MFAIVMCLAIGAGWFAVASPTLPFIALTHLTELERPVSIGVQAIGTGLALTGGVLVLAGFALGRVDL